MRSIMRQQWLIEKETNRESKKERKGKDNGQWAWMWARANNGRVRLEGPFTALPHRCAQNVLCVLIQIKYN